jgi:hypothetical protein
MLHPVQCAENYSSCLERGQIVGLNYKESCQTGPRSREKMELWDCSFLQVTKANEGCKIEQETEVSWPSYSKGISELRW